MTTLQHTASIVESVRVVRDPRDPRPRPRPEDPVDLAGLLDADAPEPSAADRAWLAEQAGGCDLPEPAAGLPMADWVRMHGSYFRTLGTTAGDGLAAAIDGIALAIEAYGATSWEEFRDGERLADSRAERRVYDQGYREGYRAARWELERR